MARARARARSDCSSGTTRWCAIEFNVLLDGKGNCLAGVEGGQ